MWELAPDQNCDTYCLLVCLLTNMIQIHSSNYYTDLMCSSCLGQQGPTTIRFLNHNYQIFLKKTNSPRNDNSRNCKFLLYMCIFEYILFYLKFTYLKLTILRAGKTSNFRIQFCNFFLKKNPL